MEPNVFVVSFDGNVNPDERLLLKDQLGNAVRGITQLESDVRVTHMSPTATLSEMGQQVLEPIS